MKRYYFFIALVVASLILVIGTIVQLRFNTFFTDIVGSDDAFISYRYAENLFHGHGLVFNIGERVEGYSNLLYTLLIVPAFLIGKEFVYTYSLLLNLLLGLGCLYIFTCFLYTRFSLREAIIGAILFSANPILWLHINTGLESLLVLCLQMFAWISLERYLEKDSSRKHFLLFLLSIGLLLFTRVDGFIFAAISIVYLSIFRKKYQDGLIAAVVAIVLEGSYIAARYFYYGDILNNAYYAKVSGSLLNRVQHGYADFVDIVLHSGYWQYAIILVITLLFFIVSKVIKRPQLSTLNSQLSTNNVWSFPHVASICLIAYWIFIGGDVFHERFLLLLYPLGIYMLLSLSKNYFNTMVAGIVAVCYLVASLSVIGNNPHIMYASNGPKDDMWITLGQYLKLHEPNTATLAVDAAGKIPFFSELYTIDMLGLNDKHIAHIDVSNREFIVGHNKYDPDYILARHPDLIASWVTDHLDAYWGLTREKYQSQYHIKYLLSGGTVINVEQLSPEEVSEQIRRGFNYGVLAR